MCVSQWSGCPGSAAGPTSSNLHRNHPFRVCNASIGRSLAIGHHSCMSSPKHLILTGRIASSPTAFDHEQSRGTAPAFVHSRSHPTDHQTEQAVLDPRRARGDATLHRELPWCSQGHELEAAYGLWEGTLPHETEVAIYSPVRR